LFDNRLAIQPTAQALFIHRNSLNKRLRRIESLVQVDLSNLDDVIELYLGLRAAELLGEAAVAAAVAASPDRQAKPRRRRPPATG
jgi:carbohydrate diacid regulator